MREPIEAQTVVDFATNTGPLYGAHKRLAREWPNDLELWKSHITANVLPQLRRELHLPGVVIRSNDLTAAARALRDYYVEHVRELPR